MSPRITVGQTGETCAIQDCTAPRLYWVARLEQVFGVCGRCMEELMSVRGWEMLRSIADGQAGPLTSPEG